MKLRRISIAVLLWGALIPSLWMAWRARDMPRLGAEHDDSIYWVSAKSLAEGHGYRIASLPGQPYQTKYPPLFPLWLALIWRLWPAFPANLPIAALFAWILLPVYLCLALLLFRDLGLSNRTALALGVVLALNQQVTIFSMSLMPELMFSCLVLIALALGIRAERGKAWLAAAGGLAGAAAYLTKSAGAPLALAVPLWLLWRRKYARAALFLAAMLPAMIGWILWVRSKLAPAADLIALYYTDYLGYHLYNVSRADLPLVIWTNFDRLLWGAGGLLLFGQGESVWPLSLSRWLPLAGLAWRVLALIAISATVRSALRKGIAPHHLFAAGYMLLLLLWHFPPNERFVFPVFPILLAGLADELSFFARRNRSAFAVVAAPVVALGLFLIYDGYARSIPAQVASCRNLDASNRRAYQWIAANLRGDARFLAYDDPVLYLYTGRQACRVTVPPRFFYHRDRDGVDRLFRSMGELARHRELGYVLTAAADFHGELLPSEDHLTGFQRLARANPGLRPVYRSPLTSIYRIE